MPSCRVVTKHRNPWKGLKHAPAWWEEDLFSCYKAQKSLEGIETFENVDLVEHLTDVTKHRNPWKGLKLGASINGQLDLLTLQSTEIPGRD